MENKGYEQSQEATGQYSYYPFQRRIPDMFTGFMQGNDNGSRQCRTAGRGPASAGCETATVMTMPPLTITTGEGVRTASANRPRRLPGWL